METYKHTQVGYTLLMVLIVVLALSLLLGWEHLSALPFVILIVIAMLFCTLTVEIKNGILTWYFGPKFWRKKVDIKDIKAVNVVENKWWYGFGIRLTPHGWLYNVSGLQAVEIALTNGKKIRIGTDEPEMLQIALKQQMQSSRIP